MNWATPALLLALAGCGASDHPMDASGKAGWLAGSAHEQMDTVARHLRGNDVAMWEVGYRFGELYWAGTESNWQLAGYQLTKIDLAMHLALQRRPGRAESYATYFREGPGAVEGAIAARDAAAFATGFEELTAACNRCHVSEDLGFFLVRTPDVRIAPLGAPAEAR